jgi:hypothetical protein
MAVASRSERMRVLLTKKLANHIDGVDISAHKVGEVFEVSPKEGHLLIAEQWAIPDRRATQRPQQQPPQVMSAVTSSR